MAATANSTYQALRTKHIAGNPPNTDPQRASETFTAYVARMAANGLNPDINATESDADYLVRLASYLPAPPITAKLLVTKDDLNNYTGSFVNGVLTTLV